MLAVSEIYWYIREPMMQRAASSKSPRIFPGKRIYALTDQIRRASRSIGAQIAEAWGKRRYEKHFVSKLTDADAEQLETQHWLSIAVFCG